MSQYSLSSFQEEKLKYYFKFLEPNEKNELDRSSLQKFINRVLEFTGWDKDSADAKTLYEVHQAFYEILFDKTSGAKSAYCEGEDCEGEAPTVCEEDWISVWSNLLPGCMGMNHFPVWLRLLPKQLFRAIDRDQDGKIKEEELFNFYLEMVKLPYEESKANAKLAYAQMTDNGHYPLNQNSYEQMFANFLLGRTPHGPGRFIFGCFEHKVSKAPFCLIQPAPEPEDIDMDVKVYLEKRPKRMSITALT